MSKRQEEKPKAPIPSTEPAQSLPDEFVTFCVARDGDYFSIYQLEKRAGEMGLRWKKIVEKTPRHMAAREASLRLMEYASTGEF